MNYKSVLNALKRHKKFLVSTHVNPDPDALCSQMAIAMLLRSWGKTVTVVNHTALPERFRFLPHINHIKVYHEHMKVDYDVALVVDCGGLDRIGKVSGLLQKGKLLINIDHHITNDHFGNINLVNSRASSTCEILYELIKQGKFALDKTIALYLYAGIMTDTGSFRYENTTPRTFFIVSELKRFSFSATELYRKFYESIPLSDLKEFTKILSHFNSCQNGKVVVVRLSKRLLRKFSQEFDLRDAIFKFLRAIKGVEVLMILSEAGKRQTRVNFRSSGKVNVAQLAHRFGGGGHHNASGCLIEKNIKAAEKSILKIVERLV